MTALFASKWTFVSDVLKRKNECNRFFFVIVRGVPVGSKSEAGSGNGPHSTAALDRAVGVISQIS